MALNDRQLSLKRSLKQQLIEGNATVDFVELSKLAGQLVGLLFKDLSKSDVDEVVSELTKEEEIVLAGGGTVYDPKTFKKWLGIAVVKFLIRGGRPTSSSSYRATGRSP